MEDDCANLLSVHCDYAQGRTEVDEDDQCSELVGLGVNSEDRFCQCQMPRGGNREELGQSLDESEEDGVE